MMRQLFLPLHQAHSLIAGNASRVFVRKNKGDAASLTDEGWLITDIDGHQRFAVGDRIAIAVPQVSHVLTVALTRLSDTPVSLAKLSHAVAKEHGYPDVADLWQDFAFRYDHVAHKYWIYTKRHVARVDHADVFRKFLETRDPYVWRAWSLHVVLESVNAKVQERAS